MRLFLVIAITCLVIFVVAGLLAGELIPYLGQSQHSFRAKRVQGASLWQIVQNVSAVIGIVSFLIQVVQWSRGGRR